MPDSYRTGIFDWQFSDGQFHLADADEQARRLLGLSDQSAINLSCEHLDRFPIDLASLLDTVARTGMPQSAASETIDADGERALVDVICTPASMGMIRVYLRQRKIEGLTEVQARIELSDLTRQSGLSLNLSPSETLERLDRSERFADVGSFTYNSNTGEMLWSPNLCRLLGYGESDCKPNLEQLLSHFDEATMLERALRLCRNRRRESLDKQIAFRRRNGDQGVMRVHLAPPKPDGHGTFLCHGTLRDITSDLKTNETLSKLQACREIMTGISARLINSPRGEAEHAIQYVLAKIGSLSGVDLALVSIIEQEHDAMRVPFLWHKDVAADAAQFILHLDTSRFKRALKEVRDGIIFDWPEVNDLQAEYSEEVAACETAGLRSVLAIPVMLNRGSIAVVCFANLTPRPWVNETRDMLFMTSGIVAAALIRLTAEEVLAKATADLERDRAALKRKNIALKEVLNQIQQEKQEIREQIADNVDKLIRPALHRVRGLVGSDHVTTIDSIERSLDDIMSEFTASLRHRHTALTSQETRVCSLIRNGLASKEIALSLNISIGTVNKHRERIRRKLGLQNHETNLYMYLNSL